MTTQELIQTAATARENAYVPYSHYKVGAALVADDGTVYTGANIEFVNGTSNCAERTALFHAATEGVRRFQRIAVVTEDGSGTPCGFCRQALVEFCPPDMEVIVSDIKGNYRSYTLEQLLPVPFTPDVLQK